MTALTHLFPVRLAIVLLWLGTLPACGLGLMLILFLGGEQDQSAAIWQTGLMFLLGIYPCGFLISGHMMYVRRNTGPPHKLAVGFHTCILIVGAVIVFVAIRGAFPALDRVPGGSGVSLHFLILGGAAALAWLAYLRILAARLSRMGGSDHALS